MFCVLSGLQSIDDAYYEAATVDGATYWQKLFQITIPLVRPSLTVSTVLNIIYVFNSFPIIWTITKGDPANRTDTLVTYLYKLAFYNGKSGEAAAVSVIGFLILCACASVYMVLSLRKEGSDE
jgi:multiple sugar transport system permease protein